ncbi:MAG: peptidylprolyl isomerase [Bacteroidetes bacterium]|nr:peptidylprolyl isomerase [Bacteroidota bacterium]
MRPSQNNKLLTLLFLLVITTLSAQAVVIDSTNVIKDDIPESTVKRDTVKTFKRFKAEGVSAVIGEYVVLDSDIDLEYIELVQRGIPVEDVTRCQLLGKLMEDKLYAHHAEQDSLVVTDAEINQTVDQQMQYIIGELGGDEDKVARFYKKNNIGELREDFFATHKTLMLAAKMQRKVVEEIEVTPEEVREFFFSIPEEDRPFFSAEVEVAQIVVEPEITEKAKKDVIDKLNGFRRDIVENGASFASKAVLYSKDATRSRGGLIEGVKRNSPMAKEFKDVAFSLLEGEVSEPFETEFGWHLLTVDKVRGQELDVRHIIVFPDVSQATIDTARAKIDSIRVSIIAEKIDFATAARIYSSEKETRNNGGQLVNPVSFDTRFDLTKMDPTLSAQVYNLKEGEVSKVFTDRDYTGKNKFKILTVTKRYEEHPAEFSKDYEKIKDLALKQKQIRTIEKWQSKKIQETYVSVNRDYNDCEFSSNWIKN